MNILKSKNIRFYSTLFAIFFALPIQLAWLTGIFNWLSPFILLNSVLLLKSLVMLNGLGFIIFISGIFHKRWFCKYLCPVGFGCDYVSNLSPRKNKYLRKVPSLGRWLYLTSFIAALFGIPLFILLDPMAIFNGFFSVFSEPFKWVTIFSFMGLPVLIALHYFFPGIWCTKLCPLGGLFDDIYLLRKTTEELFNRKQGTGYSATTSRRLFIVGGTGIIAGLLIPKFLQSKKEVKFRPPASLSDPMFSTLCIRCGSCIKVCPTGIIQHYSSSENVLAWMTPEITFDKGGYCKEDCNLCGTVCPTGSISPFSIPAKKKLFIASIKIDLDKCLLSRQTECDRCRAVCSYNAIDIVPTQKSLIMKPEVNPEACVGCGACVLICPEETIKMIRLETNIQVSNL